MKAVVISPNNGQVQAALIELVSSEQAEWKRKRVRVGWVGEDLHLRHALFGLVRSEDQKVRALANARKKAREMLVGFEEGVDYEVSLQ